MRNFVKTVLAAVTVMLLAAQPALADNPAQRLSLASAAKGSVRAGTPVSETGKQMETIPVWMILAGVAVVGVGVYFVAKGNNNPSSP